MTVLDEIKDALAQPAQQDHYFALRQNAEPWLRHLVGMLTVRLTLEETDLIGDRGTVGYVVELMAKRGITVIRGDDNV